MDKYCTHCGKELKEGADVCLNCGILINRNVTDTNTKSKIPGRGKAIAGMVLGIVACVWAFIALLELEDLPYNLEYYYSLSDYVGYAIGYTLFSFTPSIVGLCLSISSIKKQKSGKNTAGLVLNIIALLVSILLIFTVIAHK